MNDVAEFNPEWHGNFGETHANARLKAEDIYAIRDVRDKGEMTQVEVARKYGISVSWVYRIERRTAWKHLAERGAS